MNTLTLALSYTATVTEVSVRVTGRYKRVTLDWLSSGFANQPNQIFPLHTLWSGGPGVVVDLLFDDSAVDVISSKAQSDLCDLGSSSSANRL